MVDWVRSRCTVEGSVPAGWMSRRPDDQRMYNFIFRWKYDCITQQLGNKPDFREAAADTDAKMVLASLALTMGWMNNHPDVTVAAWLMSGVVTEAYCKVAGMEPVLERAKAAMHEAHYADVTSAYRAAGGIWDTAKVFIMHEVYDALAQAVDPMHKDEIEEVMGSIPWLSQARTDSRKRYLERVSTAQQGTNAKPKAVLHPAHRHQQGRKRRLTTATAAAKKLKEEAEQKCKQTADRAADCECALIREAAVEYLRIQFGKNGPQHQHRSWRG